MKLEVCDPCLAEEIINPRITTYTNKKSVQYLALCEHHQDDPWPTAKLRVILAKAGMQRAREEMKLEEDIIDLD